MRLVGEAEVALRIQRHQAHRAHQSLYTLTVDRVALILEPVPDTPTAIERMLQMTAVDQRHQLEFLVGDRLRHVIERRAWQLQQARIGESLATDPSGLPFLSSGPVNPFEPAF